MSVQTFNPGPYTKSECISYEAFCLQFISNLECSIYALNHNCHSFALISVHRLEDIRDRRPRKIDSRKYQQAKQKHRNDSAALSTFFHYSVPLVLLIWVSRYSCKMTAAARASTSCF